MLFMAVPDCFTSTKHYRECREVSAKLSFGVFLLLFEWVELFRD